jgi:hypothetical protein
MAYAHSRHVAVASTLLSVLSFALALDASAKSGPTINDHRTHRAQVYVPWKPNTQGPANRPPSPPKGPVVRNHK